MLLSLSSFGGVRDSLINEKQHTFRLGIGAGPVLNDLTFGLINTPNYPISPYYSGGVFMSGHIAAQYSYRPLKWLEVGGIVSYVNLSERLFDRITDANVGYSRQNTISVMANVRFSYLTSPTVRLYSGVGIGVSCNIAQSKYNEQTSSRVVATLAGQLTIIGITVGRRIYGFAELSIGTCGVVNAGIGYRFKANKR